MFLSNNKYLLCLKNAVFIYSMIFFGTRISINPCPCHHNPEE